MIIQTGNPPSDGRYVAFVRCSGRAVSEWFEPIIATWHGRRWHCMPMVYGWIGPLPVGKCIEDAFRHGRRIASNNPRGKKMPSPELERGTTT